MTQRPRRRPGCLVRLIKRPGRRFYQAEWSDPVTGKTMSRSTKETVERQAQKIADRIEEEVRAGLATRDFTPWREFRDQYFDQGVEGLADATVVKAAATFNAVEELISPKSLQIMARPQQLSEFRRLLSGRYANRKNKRPISAATINAHLRHLRAAMNWAKENGLLREVPKFPMVKRVGTQGKARAVTTEEFERIISSVAKIVDQKQVNDLEFFLQGLWLSGLRLGEALRLKWGVGPVSLHFNRRGRPEFRFEPEGQKNRKRQTVACTPDLAELIATVSDAEREGFVFDLPGVPREVWKVTKLVASISEKARVKTANDHWATPHDLRRAFGTRWASRVKPTVLKKMMRHADIHTTMKYYVDDDDESFEEAIWSAASNTDTFADTWTFFETPQKDPSPQSVVQQGHRK